jgi:phosphatidylglycerophosphate synthase
MNGEVLPVGRYTVQPIARKLADILARTAVTPNQITATGLACGVLSAAMLTSSDKYIIATGGIFTLLFWILDITDGQVARLNNMCSDFGAWFDANVDQIVENLLYLSISIAGYLHTRNVIYLIAGIVIFFGKYMYFHVWLSRQNYLTKSNEHFAQVMAENIKNNKKNLFVAVFLFWCNFDVRIHLLSFCALINRPEYALIFYAVYFNLRWASAISYIIYKRKISHITNGTTECYLQKNLLTHSH